ncbi:MAG: hypothetical protein RQ842_05005 [Vulcanisaeta sp.]|jgi:hypothetical protein|nr:hypothetical protein [Vulcanisaeta sp.]
MMRQQNIERINVNWDNNVHVIKFAPLVPGYVHVEIAHKIPNNALIIMELTNEYVLIHTSDNGDFVERFETFEELNEYLRREFGLELNKPEG